MTKPKTDLKKIFLGIFFLGGKKAKSAKNSGFSAQNPGFRIKTRVLSKKPGFGPFSQNPGFGGKTPKKPPKKRVSPETSVVR